MTASFDWDKYSVAPAAETKPAFDWEKYAVKKEKNEPVTAKGAAGAYGSGVAGGYGGVGKDVLDLAKKVPDAVRSVLLPGVDLAIKGIEAIGGKGTQELTESAQKSMGVEEPQNALERILTQSGQFGGQEAFMGTALGGPVGALAGGAHGSASGALYGGLKELGVNDNVALAVTALATISPVAARALLEKSAAKLPAAAKVSPAAQPPPPPGTTPPPSATPKIRPGTIIPETKSAFEQKEAILKELETPPKRPPLGIETQLADTTAQAPTLRGRVSEAKELGETVAKEPFETEAQAGRTIAKEVTEARDAERDLVRERYKKAEEVTASHNGIFPKLAKENEDRITRLESLEKKSAGEEAVYQDALALKRMIGTPDGLIEANADRLMKQANSFSQKVKYELPYAGYKGEIKSIVHEMNNAVIESLERAGKNSSAVLAADKAFAKFADRFMGDEISPYFKRKISNPEQLGAKAIADDATYRAVKGAIGSRTSPLVNKMDREVVHAYMDEYYKDPSKVNSKEYVKQLKGLSEKIGKEKTAEVDYFLRKKQLAHERKAMLENKIKETRLAREKLPAARARPIQPKEQIAKTPEQLDRLFKSRSDIRRLRREMKDKGLEKEFEALKDQKIEEIFKEGVFGKKKITGTDLKNIIDKEHEILTELLGSDEVSFLYKVASRAHQAALTDAIVMHVAKTVGKAALQYVGLGKLLKFIPLNSI